VKLKLTNPTKFNFIGVLRFWKAWKDKHGLQLLPEEKVHDHHGELFDPTRFNRVSNLVNKWSDQFLDIANAIRTPFTFKDDPKVASRTLLSFNKWSKVHLNCFWFHQVVKSSFLNDPMDLGFIFYVYSSLHQFNGDPFHQSFSMATHFMKRIELQSRVTYFNCGCINVFNYPTFLKIKYKWILWLLLDKCLTKIVKYCTAQGIGSCL
jgi:hypothetical protein